MIVTLLLSLLVGIGFVVTTLVIFEELYIHEIIPDSFQTVDEKSKNLQKKFFEQKMNHDKKFIYILGSSHIQSLNTTLINSEIQKTHQDYVVYVLGLPADSPNERLKNIEPILSTSPKIIFYGISMRDFQKTEDGNDIDYMQLPKPKKIISDFFNIKLSKDLEFLENPKFQTLKFMTIFLRGEKIEQPFQPYPNSLMVILPSYTEIKNDEQLKKDSISKGEHVISFGDIDSNQNIIALKEIIKLSERNGIKVVIFTTPMSHYYLDVVPSSTKNKFFEILSSINEYHDVNIHYLDEKFSYLPIWTDSTHVAVNEKSSIYSDDITKIILDELDS